MSTNIDQRVVEMKFDNKQFESGVKTTMSSMDKLKNSLNLKGVTNGFENISNAAQKCNLGGLHNVVESVSMKFSSLEVMAVTALANITNSAVNAGKKIISAFTIEPVMSGFSEYETQINAVQTILANTQKEGTTLGQVNGALDELNTYADKTIYNFTEMTRNIGTFTAAGVKLDDSVSAIKGIANLAAISGSNSQQASTAMYQLSQALAAGKVSLQDWNSVVNAGMGGQVFQESLERTATAMGITWDKSESFRESISAKGGRDTWLTSEVLTRTLAQFTGDMTDAQLAAQGFNKEQIKAIQLQAQTANEAATKVKTFTQLVDTLKEAAQSGWSQSWRTIIGDFEEAKEFYTEVSDSLGAIISQSNDARNKLITEGLGSGWDQFLSKGVRDEEAYIEKIKKVALDRNLITDDMLKDLKSFDDLQEKGLITTDLLSNGLNLLRSDYAGLSDEQLKAKGYTREQVKALSELNRSIQNGSISIDDFVDKMGKASGRENLIKALFNTFEALGNILKPISEAFKEVFKPLTGDQLYGFTESLRDLTANFKLSDTTINNIKSTFKGLFSVLGLVKNIVVAVGKGIFSFVGVTGSLGSNILSLTAVFGDWITKVNDFIKNTDMFNRVFTGIGKVINAVLTAITSVITVVNTNFVTPGLKALYSFWGSLLDKLSLVFDGTKELSVGFEKTMESVADSVSSSKVSGAFDSMTSSVKSVTSKISSLFSGVFQEMGDMGVGEKITHVTSGFGLLNTGLDTTKSKVSGLTDGVKNMAEKFNSSVSDMGEKISGSSLFSVLDSIWHTIVKMTAGIGGAFMKMFDSLKIGGGNPGLATLFDFIDTASLTTITVCLVKFINTIKAPFKGVDKIIDGVVGVLDGLQDTLKAYQKSIKADVLKKIATAIAILAGSLFVMSLIDAEKLLPSVGALSILLLELTVVMGVFGKISKKSGDVVKASLGMIGVSVAVLLLASALKSLSDLQPEKMWNGLIAVTGILTALAFFTKATEEAKGMVSLGLGLIALGAAMKIFSHVLKDMGSIPMPQLIQGFITMAASLTAITVALKFMPKNTLAIGVGLIGVATAMTIFSGALRIMGGMSDAQMTTAIKTLGYSLLGLSVALNLMNDTLKGSAALIIATTALSLFVPTLVILGMMSWESIAKGLAALAGVFVILGVSALALSPLIGIIAVLAASIGVIGVGTLAFGTGLIAIGAGLVSVSVGLALLSTTIMGSSGAITTALTIIMVGITNLIPMVLASFANGIVEFLETLKNSIPAICESFKVIIFSMLDTLIESVPRIVEGILVIIDSVMQSLANHTPSLVQSLFEIIIGVLNGIADNLPDLIQAVVNVIMALFTGVYDALTNIDSESLVKAILSIGLMSGLMIALAGMALLTPAAMIGVVGMGIVIAELALVLAAIGRLSLIPGLKWMINQGAGLLGAIGNAIGSFIGGIIGGAMNGISNSLPNIGTNLSNFMVNITPFLDGAKLIDANTLNSVKALAETILILTAANILDGLTSWFTGGSSLSSFGKELSEFGPYFNKYYESIKGVDGSIIQSSSDAALSLAEMASKLPNNGGMVSWFTGENSLSVFAEELALFGPKLKEYADSIQGLDSSIVIESANAALSLSELATNLPNQGGMVSWFTGDNSLSVFAEELSLFGPVLKEYANSVRGLDSDIVINSANAALSLAEMATNLPEQGGAVSWFTGDNSLSIFAEELALFGPKLKEYADSVTGLDAEVVTNSANSAKALSELATNLPNQGGMVSWFTGDNDMGTFGESLVVFGESFSKYSDHVKNVKSGVVTSTSNAATSIVELQKSLPKSGGWFSNEKTLTDFGNDLAGFGAKFADYYSYVKDVNTMKLATVITKTQALIDLATGMNKVDTEGMNSFGTSLKKLGEIGVDGFINAFDSAKSKITDTASTMLNAFLNKADSFKSSFATTFTNLIKQASASISSYTYYTKFYDAGKYMVQGFANGISVYTYLASAKAKTMASAAVNAARRELDIHSPSKVSYGIGSYFGVGFVNALSDYSSKAYTAGTDIAKSAKDGLNNSINNVSGLLGNIEDSPTIRPVLDLTEIQNGKKQLYSMMNGLDNYSLSGSLDTVNKTSRSFNQATSMSSSDSINKELTNALKDIRSTPNNKFENVFNITGTDANDIADKVSRKIQQQVNRKGAVWA